MKRKSIRLCCVILSVLMIIGLMPVTHVAASGERVYLEDDIVGLGGDVNRFPAAGSFTMGGRRFTRGISHVGTAGIGGVAETMREYDISGRNFTRLQGVVGLFDVGGGELSGHNRLAVIAGGNRVFLGTVLHEVILTSENELIEIDVAIPQGTQNIFIRLERNTTRGRVGFGDAFFTTGGPPQQAQQQTVTITLSAGREGLNRGTATGGGTFNVGETVTVSATANPGWRFTHWEDFPIIGNRITDATFSFTAETDRTLLANFEQVQQQTVRIGIIAQPPEGGTVSMTPGGGTLYETGWLGTRVPQNSTVTLRASANPGWTFAGWHEDGTTNLVSANANFSFTATEHRSLWASFTRQQGGGTGAGTDDLPGDGIVTTDDLPGGGTTGGGRYSDWAADYIRRAYELNLVPNALSVGSPDLRLPITRREFAGVALHVYENLANTRVPNPVRNPFTDTRNNDVIRAFDAGIMIGISDTEFAPDWLLNRETAATALTRAFRRWYFPGSTFATDGNYRLLFDWPERFADDRNISYWAEESVYFMAANGIIVGTGNNMFSPRAVTSAQEAEGYAMATREQALIMAVRLVQSF